MRGEIMHKRFAFILIAVSIATGALAQSRTGATNEDLTITKTISVGGNTLTSQILLKGKRERSETPMPGASNITIRQCDLHRTLTINEDRKNFFVRPDMETVDAIKSASGGAVTFTSTVVDTGEKKQVFGYTARHLKISIVAESSANACSPIKQKYEIDGWYIELPGQTDCQRFSPYLPNAQSCQDQLLFKNAGKIKPGYPIQETVTVQNGDGPAMSVNTEVTDIKKAPLDAALFDVPQDFHQVKAIAELQGSTQGVPSAGNAAPAAPPSTGASAPRSTQRPSTASAIGGMILNPQGQMAAQQQAMTQMQGMAPANGMPNFGPGNTQPSAGLQPLGPKAPGKIRIGVVVPQAQLGQGSNAQTDYATPLRNAIVQMMNGPAVEVTTIDARIPIQIEAEAKQKECDFLLYSSVTIKHGGGGGFGKLMSKAGPLTNAVPMLGGVGAMAGGNAGAAAQMGAQIGMQGATSQTVNQLGAMNGQIKSKDEVTMSYQLIPAGQDSAKLANSLQAKASADNQDIITPMITQIATAVLIEVTKK
jgi:hypothetical protein